MLNLSINIKNEWTVNSHSYWIYDNVEYSSDINHIKIFYIKYIHNYTLLVKFQKLVIYINWYYIHYSNYKIEPDILNYLSK